jgi:hypothetical protein
MRTAQICLPKRRNDNAQPVLRLESSALIALTLTVKSALLRWPWLRDFVLEANVKVRHVNANTDNSKSKSDGMTAGQLHGSSVESTSEDVVKEAEWHCRQGAQAHAGQLAWVLQRVRQEVQCCKWPHCPSILQHTRRPRIYRGHIHPQTHTHTHTNVDTHTPDTDNIAHTGRSRWRTPKNREQRVSITSIPTARSS